MAEMTQVSEQSAPGEPKLDRIPELVALGSFAGAMLLGVGLILIQFQLPEVVTKVGPWVAAVAFGLYLRVSVPSAKLHPARRAQRDDRRAGAMIGVLSACTVLASMAAATYLTSWADWLVLGVFVALAFGVGLMLHVRFTIGA